jgi:hypothetical protein
MRTLFYACLSALLMLPVASEAKLSVYAPVPTNRQVIEFADSVLASARQHIWRLGYENHDAAGSVRIILTMFDSSVVGVSFFKHTGLPDVVRVAGLAYGARSFRIDFVGGACVDVDDPDAIPCSSATATEWRRLYEKAVLFPH